MKLKLITVDATNNVQRIIFSHCAGLSYSLNAVGTLMGVFLLFKLLLHFCISLVQLYLHSCLEMQEMIVYIASLCRAYHFFIPTIHFFCLSFSIYIYSCLIHSYDFCFLLQQIMAIIIYCRMNMRVLQQRIILKKCLFHLFLTKLKNLFLLNLYLFNFMGRVIINSRNEIYVYSLTNFISRNKYYTLNVSIKLKIYKCTYCITYYY